MLSIVMLPELGSSIRKRVRSNEDFPEPVRPTMPIFEPWGMERFILLRTRGDVSLYCGIEISVVIEISFLGIRWLDPCVNSEALYLGSLLAT